jgi:hypothetical protein
MRRSGDVRKSVKDLDLGKVKKVALEKLEEERKGKREEEAGVRRSTRQASKYKPATNPSLTFRSRYKGEKTQKWDEVQAIGFEQVAQLTWNAGAPYDIANYFELRQYVYDSAKHAGHDAEVRAWELDGPYHPPYSNAQTQAAKTTITFTDEPGFSSTGISGDNAKIAAGEWLESYTVSFYWEVTRIDTGMVWRSPTVTHTVTSAPEEDRSDAPVNAVAAGSKDWVITTLPPAG